MHYFKRNIGEYHKKAGKLSMLEHGAYTLLIDACYDREKFPTLDDAIDWTWARTEEEIAAVNFVLRKFFTPEGAVYIQNRIKEEIESYHANSLINKDIALKREAKKRNERARTVHEHRTNEHELAPKQEPRTIKQEPETKNQEPENINQELINTNKVKNTPTANAEAVEVFAHWQARMNHPGAKLDAKRTKQITEALKLGYTVEHLKAAIDGCAKSPFHMGNNDRHTVFDSIELIFRSADKIDTFIKLNNTEIKPGAGYEQPKSNLDKLIQQYGQQQPEPPPADYIDGEFLDSDGGDLWPTLGPVIRADS